MAPSPDLERSPRLKLHKRLEGYITAIFKLGRTERMAKQALRKGDALEGRLNAELGDLAARLNQLDCRAEDGENRAGRFERLMAEQRIAQASGQAALSRSISDLTSRLDRLMLRQSGGGEGGDPQPLPGSDATKEGLEAFLGQVLHRLELRQIGSSEERRARFRPLLADVKAAVSRCGRLPILDLGCGTGDWLAYLQGESLKARGVEVDAAAAKEARDRGLEVEEADAVSALEKAEDESLSVISALGLLEYLPFDQAACIVREAQRVLAPGGLLLVETPDARNLQIGATAFHADPNRTRLLPEQVLEVLFETAGFDPIEARRLNAHPRFDEFLAKPDMNDELAFLLFGPRDLAMLGIKPKEE